MAAGYDIGASSSTSSAATSGYTGAVNITGGNTGGMSWTTLAFAAIGLVILVIIFGRRKGRR